MTQDSVALVHDEGAGALFFSQVCSMLERLAGRTGVTIHGTGEVIDLDNVLAGQL